MEKLKKTDISSMMEIDRENFLGKAWEEKDYLVFFESGLLLAYKLVHDQKLIAYFLALNLFGSIDIIRVSVAKEFQGQGLAFKFLKEIIDKHVQFKTWILEHRVSNQRAHNLYLKLNFKLNRIRKQYYEDGEDAIEMILNRGEYEQRCTYFSD